MSVMIFQAHSVVIKEIVENGTSTDPHVLSDADLHSLDPLGEFIKYLTKYGSIILQLFPPLV